MEPSQACFSFHVESKVNQLGLTVFSIKVKQNDQEWNVERSVSQCMEFAKNTFFEFQEVVDRNLIDRFCGDFQSVSPDEIRILLERVYSQSSNLAATAALFAFLDDLERASWFTRSHIRHLQSQITDISSKLASYEMRLSRFEINAGKIDALLSSSLNPVAINNFSSDSVSLDSTVKLTAPSMSSASNTAGNNSETGSSNPSTKYAEDAFDMNSSTCIDDSGKEKDGEDSIVDNLEQFSLVKEDSKDFNLVTEDILEAQKMWDDLSLSREDSGNSSASIPEDPTDESVLNSVFSADYMLLSNADAYPLENISEVFLQSFFSEIDGLMRLVQPHDTQLQYRSAAVNYVRKQARIALGCLTYEIGQHAMNCFLPTDPIRVTLPLVQSQIPQWPAALSDRLKNISEGNITVPKSVDMTLIEDTVEDMTELFQNGVRNVNIVHDSPATPTGTSTSSTPPLISFQFENSIECHIGCNQRLELCNIAFLQEFANLVGKDNLFKRSLLLIRGWWEYESSSYVSTPMKAVLTEQCLAYMLVCIFNNYHHRIQNPLEAFVLFLREFSVYDGRSHAISMQGIVPFHSETANQPCLVKPQANQLITHEMLERYWHVFNVNDPSIQDPVTVNAFPTNAATAAAAATPSFLAAGGGALSRNGIASTPASNLNQLKSRQIALMNSMNKTISKFERCSFNIIHPFLHTNIITEKLSATRKLSLVTKVFQMTYANIKAVLDQVKVQYYSANSSMMIAEALRRLLPSVYSRFSNHFRPDAVGNSIYLSQSGKDFSNDLHYRDIMNVSIDKIWENVTYCNFIVENLISESAILTFCADTLTVKGPLPAGELGKLLSEASSIPNLSHKLREKFGGLKKFLERYADKFIFSNDHPFNPHVLLRSTISAENLELIDRGIFPIHLISKSARAAAAAKKQQQTQSAKHQPVAVANTSNGAGSPPQSSANLKSSPVTAYAPCPPSLATPVGVPSMAGNHSHEVNTGSSASSANVYYHKNIPVSGQVAGVSKAQYANLNNNALPSGSYYQQQRSPNMPYSGASTDPFAPGGLFPNSSNNTSNNANKASRSFFQMPSLSAAAQQTSKLFRSEYFHSNSSKQQPSFSATSSSVSARYQSQVPPQQQIQQDGNRHFGTYSTVNNANNDLLGFNGAFSVPNDATVPSSEEFSFNTLVGLSGNQGSANSPNPMFLGLSRGTAGSTNGGSSGLSNTQDYFADNNKSTFHSNSLKLSDDNNLFLSSNKSDDRAHYRLNGGMQASNNDFNQQSFDGVGVNHPTNSQTFNNFRFY